MYCCVGGGGRGGIKLYFLNQNLHEGKIRHGGEVAYSYIL